VVDRRESWIVDGHNMIFGLPHLAVLQRQGEKARAREQLEALLRSFAATRGPLILVYDGNRAPPDPEARQSRTLRVVFSHPPQCADDLIVELAAGEQRRGMQVTVVTDDQRSLIPRLPAGVASLGIEAFHQRLIGRRPAEPTMKRPRLSPAEAEGVAAELLAREGLARPLSAGEARRREREAREQWLARTGRRGAPGSRGPGEGRAGGAGPEAGEVGSLRPRRAEAGAAAGSSGAPGGGAQGAQGRDEAARRRKRERGLRKQRRRLARAERSSSKGARRKAARRKGWR